MKLADQRKTNFSSLKTIGVIGGLGPQATMDFEFRIHRVSQELIPQHQNGGYPPMMVYYVREAPLVLSNNGLDSGIPQPSSCLLEAAKKVGSLADFLVIASNTPHFFVEQIERVSECEVLSMVDVTMEEVRRQRLRRVGVLGVGVTLKNKLYQQRLEQIGVMWETIPDTLAAKLDESIWALMEGREGDGSNEVAREAIHYLRAKNVDSIILGCTELPLLLKDDAKDHDLLNPSQLLAVAAVKYAILPSTDADMAPATRTIAHSQDL